MKANNQQMELGGIDYIKKSTGKQLISTHLSKDKI